VAGGGGGGRTGHSTETDLRGWHTVVTRNQQPLNVIRTCGVVEARARIWQVLAWSPRITFCVHTSGHCAERPNG